MQTKHRLCLCHSKEAYFQIRLDGIDCRMGMNRQVCPPDSRGYRAPGEKLERNTASCPDQQIGHRRRINWWRTAPVAPITVPPESRAIRKLFCKLGVLVPHLAANSANWPEVRFWEVARPR